MGMLPVHCQRLEFLGDEILATVLGTLSDGVAPDGHCIEDLHSNWIAEPLGLGAACTSLAYSGAICEQRFVSRYPYDVASRW